LPVHWRDLGGTCQWHVDPSMPMATTSKSDITTITLFRWPYYDRDNNITMTPIAPLTF